VKNPSSLITFTFADRKLTTLSEIDRFRNLTELDVKGNLLHQEVPQLMKLPFLKKLNLSGNQITQLWALPHTLEILNIGQN
jgi:Leucine-rich repeat (LRR) protein